MGRNTQSIDDSAPPMGFATSVLGIGWVLGGCSRAVDEHVAVGTHGTPQRSDLGRKLASVDACDGQEPRGTAVTEHFNPRSLGTKRRLPGLTAVPWDSEGVSGILWTIQGLSPGVKSAGRPQPPPLSRGGTPAAGGWSESKGRRPCPPASRPVDLAPTRKRPAGPAAGSRSSSVRPMLGSAMVGRWGLRVSVGLRRVDALIAALPGRVPGPGFWLGRCSQLPRIHMAGRSGSAGSPAAGIGCSPGAT